MCLAPAGQLARYNFSCLDACKYLKYNDKLSFIKENINSLEIWGFLVSLGKNARIAHSCHSTAAAAFMQHFQWDIMPI